MDSYIKLDNYHPEDNWTLSVNASGNQVNSEEEFEQFVYMSGSEPYEKELTPEHNLRKVRSFEAQGELAVKNFCRAFSGASGYYENDGKNGNVFCWIDGKHVYSGSKRMEKNDVIQFAGKDFWDETVDDVKDNDPMYSEEELPYIVFRTWVHNHVYRADTALYRIKL